MIISTRLLSDTFRYMCICLTADIYPSRLYAAAVLPQDAENSWAFDIFGFADATPGYSLSLLFCHLVKRTGLSEKLFIDEIRLNKFARRIERGYDATNPYHNSIHVASVVQTTHMLMCYGGVMKSQAFSLRQQIATYFSALVHDFEHGGVNNDFLVHTHHIATASSPCYLPCHLPCYLPCHLPFYLPPGYLNACLTMPALLHHDSAPWYRHTVIFVGVKAASAQTHWHLLAFSMWYMVSTEQHARWHVAEPFGKKCATCQQPVHTDATLIACVKACQHVNRDHNASGTLSDDVCLCS